MSDAEDAIHQQMPREIRPLYGFHIDSFCGAVLLFSSLGCWGGIEILRHRYFAGAYLLVPSSISAILQLLVYGEAVIPGFTKHIRGAKSR
ncbi:hypothetical protein EON80_31375 [bacterium]|nr:MAG: hypothetical protein EON80_31375 [bacterium]